MRKAICLLIAGLLAGSLNAALVVDSDFESGLDGWTTSGNVTIQDVDGSKVLRPVSYSTDLWEVKKSFTKQTDTNTVVMLDFKADIIDNGKVGIAILQGEWPWKYMIDVRLTKTTMTIGGTDYAVDNSNWQTLKLAFDYSARTYDVLLGAKGGTLSAVATDVAMNTTYSVSSITEVRIREEPAATRSTVYFDNVKIGVVPEPATLTVTSMGLAGMLIRKRK